MFESPRARFFLDLENLLLGVPKEGVSLPKRGAPLCGFGPHGGAERGNCAVLIQTFAKRKTATIGSMGAVSTVGGVSTLGGA